MDMLSKNTNYKYQSTNKTQITNNKSQRAYYNLEERTLGFSRDIIRLCKKLQRDIINVRIIGQLVNAAGSVGANYREANEALSKKDFVYRAKIARKECKEASYWLELLKEANQDRSIVIDKYIQESKEIRNILTSIIKKF